MKFWLSITDLLAIDAADLPVYHFNGKMIEDLQDSPSESYRKMYKKAKKYDDWWYSMNIWGTIVKKMMQGESAFILPIYQFEFVLTTKIKQGNPNNMTYLRVSLLSYAHNIIFQADHALYTPGLDENRVIGDFVHDIWICYEVHCTRFCTCQ